LNVKLGKEVSRRYILNAEIGHGVNITSFEMKTKTDKKRLTGNLDIASYSTDGPVGEKSGVVVVFSRATKANVRVEHKKQNPNVNYRQFAIGENITQSMSIKDCYQRINCLELEVARLKIELAKKR